VCPEHIVTWIYSKLPGSQPPPDVRARAVELKHVRQLTWFYSRSSEATVNNISSAVKQIRKFEAAIYGGSHGALVYCVACHHSKVKVQSLGAESSAIGQLYAASGIANPLFRPERGLVAPCY
jgi:hypothetical protein